MINWQFQAIDNAGSGVKGADEPLETGTDFDGFERQILLTPQVTMKPDGLDLAVIYLE